MSTVLIIGGFNQKGYEEMGKKKGKLDILFHDGLIKRQSSIVFENLVKKADGIVLIPSACSHRTMWEIKKLSKKYAVPVIYTRTRGLTEVINSAIELLNNKVSFFAS